MNQLPSSLQPFVDILGRSSALALVEKCYERRHFYKGYGSFPVYVPKKINRNHWIMQTVGLTKAQKLSEQLGGESFPVPKCVSLKKASRNSAIAKKRAEGNSIDNIAKEFSVSTWTVERVLNPLMSEKNRNAARERKRRRSALAMLIQNAQGGAIGTSEAGR